MGDLLVTWGLRLLASMVYVAIILWATGLTFVDAKWWVLLLSSCAYWAFMEVL